MSDSVTATGGDTDGTTDWLNEMGLDVATMMRLRIQQGESTGLGVKILLVKLKSIPVQMRKSRSCRRRFLMNFGPRMPFVDCNIIKDQPPSRHVPQTRWGMGVLNSACPGWLLECEPLSGRLHGKPELAMSCHDTSRRVSSLPPFASPAWVQGLVPEL